MNSLEAKTWGFCLSPKRNTKGPGSDASTTGSSSPSRKSPKSPRQARDGISDVAVIKSFVRKLGNRRSDFSELVTLQTRIVMDEREMGLMEFLNVSRSQETEPRRARALTFCRHYQTLTSYSNDMPNTKISTAGKAMKGSGFITVVIEYDHNNVKGGPLPDPFPYKDQGEVEPERPEMLQCVVEDGKLRQIHWKAVEKPNRKGMIRYVKTKARRPG
jgi:hypothetical protein